jgi:hypothetical protein
VARGGASVNQYPILLETFKGLDGQIYFGEVRDGQVIRSCRSAGAIPNEGTAFDR